jgi:mRNA-degrading endonuclease toxin of MazEF toxin-antitoxin module
MVVCNECLKKISGESLSCFHCGLPVVSSFLDAPLNNLKSQIMSLPTKQQQILSRWIDTWGTYIDFEKNFEPNRLKSYKRGEIIHIHLGYNVGNEEGGTRFAVVVENENEKNNGIITVIPISTLGNGQTAENLHHSEVYLGKIIPGSNEESRALLLHIRGISKIRIIKPKKASHVVYKLSDEKLTEIDNRIKLLFTRGKV